MSSKKCFREILGDHNKKTFGRKGKTLMISGRRTTMNAAECADRAEKHAFGLNDKKTAIVLRQLADDIEAGTVVLHSVTTSSHATHEEFTIREIVIEVLEEYPIAGPQVVKK